MRSKLRLRQSRPVHVTVVALMLAIPASAVALTATQADTQSAIQFTLSPRNVAYGHKVAVRGYTSPAASGQKLELEYLPTGATVWRALGATQVLGNGRFRIAMPLQHSGLVRVAPAGTGSASGPTHPLLAATSISASTTATTTTTTSTTNVTPSPSLRVLVGSELRLTKQSRDVLSGQAVDIRGRLLPGVNGRRVRLEEGTGHGGWRTLASARTGSRGGFDLHYTPGTPGQQQLRVRFAGDRANTGTSKPAGSVTAYRQSVASWYNDAGSTACGFHANLGVANKDLPCGTQVTFHYGGHTVTAVVDDRGPYIGGRDWDLNQNTAAALGFGGVDTVWSSI